MANWIITNLHKKSAVERQYWIKDGVVVTKDEGFRWGIWTCESDQQPDIDLDNPDGYNLMSTDYDWEMQEMIDGSWVDWNFPDSMPEEEQERIQALWDEDCFEGLEGDDWINDETEHWIYGPIQLTNEDTGEEFKGENQ